MEKNEKLNSNNNQEEEENEIILPEEIKKLIKFIPEEKKKEAIKIITSFTVQSASSFSGPLPPPTLLDEYSKVVKNGAERIMKMAESQSGHRIELEKHTIKEELRQSSNGQKYGFILGFIGLLLAFCLAMFGHDTVAGIFGTTTIIGLVTVFVIGRKKQQKDEE